jgi:hypothetical protein
MTIAWYDPTNHHVSTDKNDPLFTPLGQLWSLDVKREWVGLTQEEVEQFHNWKDCTWSTNELVRYVEATLRSKNT